MPHAFVPFENVCKVQLIYTEYGSRMENVFHFKKQSGSIAPSDMTSLAGGMKNWFNTALKTYVSRSVFLVLISCKDLTTQDSPGIEYSTGLPIQGAVAADGSPSNVTLAVKWTTGLSGRSYRGRTYHVGLWPDIIVSDTVASGTLAGMKTAYENLITAPITGWDLVIASSYHAGAWRTTGVATVVNAVSIDATVDSQRRRLLGRGR